MLTPHITGYGGEGWVCVGKEGEKERENEREKEAGEKKEMAKK